MSTASLLRSASSMVTKYLREASPEQVARMGRRLNWDSARQGAAAVGRTVRENPVTAVLALSELGPLGYDLIKEIAATDKDAEAVAASILEEPIDEPQSGEITLSEINALQDEFRMLDRVRDRMGLRAMTELRKTMEMSDRVFQTWLSVRAMSN